MDKIEKILERMTQIDYTAEHGKMNKDYAFAYNDALEWVLDVIFDFKMPVGTTSPFNQSSNQTAKEVEE